MREGRNDPAKSEIAQRLLRGRREAPDGWPARPPPAAHEASEQGAAGATERQGERTELQTPQSRQQADGNSRGEKRDIAPGTLAQPLSDPCPCPCHAAVT